MSKPRAKKITEWIGKNGQMKTISDIQNVDSFTDKLATKLCNSILDGPKLANNNLSKKIKGQVLQPALNESLRQVKYHTPNNTDIFYFLR